MTLPVHLDPAIPLDVPEHVQSRLRKRESSQRSRAKRKNLDLITANAKAGPTKAIDLLEVEKVDPVAIGNEQNWVCACHEVPGWSGCWSRVDITKSGRHPDAPVLGHVIAMARGGGHTKRNVRIMKHECNADIAGQVEARDVAKTNSLRKKYQGVDRNGDEYTPRKKQKIKTRPGGMQSASRWPAKGSRKIQSRNNLRKKS